MTQSPPFPLLKHPAFKGVSDAALTQLQDSTKLLRFELGQQLCEPDDIPARILVLLKVRPVWWGVTTVASPPSASSARAA